MQGFLRDCVTSTRTVPVLFTTHNNPEYCLLKSTLQKVNLEMSSTASFFYGNAIYGCSGLGHCRMLKFVSIAFLRN